MIGGIFILLVVVYLFYRMMRPLDKFEDMLLDDEEHEGKDLSSGSDIVLTAKRPAAKIKKAEKNKVRQKNKTKSLFSSCEHNYELTGFPVDKIGTHVNVTCTKCGDVQTVTVEESRELLLQRDDVRQAVNRQRN